MACPHPNKIVRYRTFKLVLNKLNALIFSILYGIAAFGIGIG